MAGHLPLLLQCAFVTAQRAQIWSQTFARLQRCHAHLYVQALISWPRCKRQLQVGKGMPQVGILLLLALSLPLCLS